jgi:hypothetical protein
VGYGPFFLWVIQEGLCPSSRDTNADDDDGITNSLCIIDLFLVHFGQSSIIECLQTLRCRCASVAGRATGRRVVTALCDATTMRPVSVTLPSGNTSPPWGITCPLYRLQSAQGIVVGDCDFSKSLFALTLKRKLFISDNISTSMDM